jgi:hypothetical protein
VTTAIDETSCDVEWSTSVEHPVRVYREAAPTCYDRCMEQVTCVETDRSSR